MRDCGEAFCTPLPRFVTPRPPRARPPLQKAAAGFEALVIDIFTIVRYGDCESLEDFFRRFGPSVLLAYTGPCACARKSSAPGKGARGFLSQSRVLLCGWLWMDGWMAQPAPRGRPCVFYCSLEHDSSKCKHLKRDGTLSIWN